MIRFYLLGFPVQIQPYFWLSCVFLGGGFYATGRQDFIDLLNWSAVMFFSILAHELGHACAGRHFGARPGIALHGLGGVTVLPGAAFTRWQSILVSAAGPAVSLALGAIFIGGAIWAGPDPAWDMKTFLRYGLFINIGWTLFNLLPIQPLDGGQIFRDLLGPRHFNVACWIGAFTGLGLFVWAILNRQYFMAIFAVFLAWTNFKGRTNLPGGVEK